jgi:Domain of unknown function (DUF4249)
MHNNMITLLVYLLFKTAVRLSRRAALPVAAGVLLFSASGCEKFFEQTIEIDPPEYKKQMVFHFNLSDQDSSAILHLSSNVGLLDPLSLYGSSVVLNATVEMYEEQQKWLNLLPGTTKNQSTRVYLAPVSNALQTGKTYTMRASHPDFKTVQARQVMPGPLNVGPIVLRPDFGVNEFGEKTSMIEVRINDPAAENNFYEIAVFGPSGYSITFNTVNGVTTRDTTYYTNSLNGSFNDVNIKTGFDNSGLVGDRAFNGKTYVYQVFIPKYYTDSKGKIELRIRSVTEDYFKWSTSYYQKISSEENPLVEPVSVYGNLENGLGIFSLCREKNFVVR